MYPWFLWFFERKQNTQFSDHIDLWIATAYTHIAEYDSLIPDAEKIIQLLVNIAVEYFNSVQFMVKRS